MGKPKHGSKKNPSGWEAGMAKTRTRIEKANRKGDGKGFIDGLEKKLERQKKHKKRPKK